MSVINKTPFLSEILSRLSDSDLTLLQDVVNGSDQEAEFVSLVFGSSNKLSSAYIGINYVALELKLGLILEGYLIYNPYDATHTDCVLIFFANDSQSNLGMFKIDVNNFTFEFVNEPLTVVGLRLAISEIMAGKGLDVKVQVDDIDSTGAGAEKVISSTADGGAEWVNLADTYYNKNQVDTKLAEKQDDITGESVESGSVAEMLGLDNEGNLVKGTVPSGSAVDSELDIDSTNPIQNKPVAEAFDELENGTRVVSKALSAQELENVSEESGNTQEEPFIYQGTGTANGTASVDTSPVGKQLEKQGNSVVVNQLIGNGVSKTYSNYTPTVYDGTKGFSNIVENAYNGLTVGHKVLVIAKISDLPANLDYVAFMIGTSNVRLDSSTQTIMQVVEVLNNTYKFIRVYTTTLDQFSITVYYKLIDLHQWFNGDILQDILDHPENFFRYYQGSLAYNTGSLENCDGRYLECGGRNAWDEEWELGQLSWSAGANSPSNNQIRSKNYIRVVPDTVYYFKKPSDTSCDIHFYDINKNHVKALYFSTTDTTFTTPSNCAYIRFMMQTNYGTTYNHDITISLYYTTGDGYDQYYPYVAPKVYDTGTEVLRSAGSVKDIKKPDGTIIRNVGSVDLGTLTWEWQGDGCAYTDDLTSLISADNVSLIDGDFIHLSQDDTSGYWNLTIAKCYYSNTDGRIYLRDSSATSSTFTSLLSGKKLFYKLAIPTTEQGTTFSENIEIDDYGTMGWKDTSEDYVAIPQGCKIFYPAWYAGFIDSLGQREDIEWTAANVVSKNELTTEATARTNQDTQLLNAIGGTLRQCLCVKETLDFEDTDFVDLGTLNWSKISIGDDVAYWAQIDNIQHSGSIGYETKMLCTKYKTANSQADFVNQTISGVEVATVKNVIVKDSTYSDATAFKNAMKGVLLAYEKAE